MPILEDKRFEVAVVVLADRRRWDRFQATLSGDERTSQARATPDHRWLRIVKSLRAFKSGLGNRFRRQHRMPKPMSKTDEALTICSERGVPTLTTHDANELAFTLRSASTNSDLFICAAYPQIFGRDLLNVPRLGSVNSHPSLLPKFRGAHPIFWVLAKGEPETGLTAHYMCERVDSGDIVAQISFPISPSETYQTLYFKTIGYIPRLVRMIGDYFENENSQAVVQDESIATVFREDREIHHLISWANQGSQDIANLVRAADGRAFFWFGDTQVFVHKCRLSNTNRNLTNDVEVPYGAVVDLHEGIWVVAKDGLVLIEEWHCRPQRELGFRVGQIFP
jgi:methionyl-tRNA formyltransferase